MILDYGPSGGVFLHARLLVAALTACNTDNLTGVVYATLERDNLGLPTGINTEYC